MTMMDDARAFAAANQLTIEPPAPPKPDTNEQTAQAFTAQIKKEHEAVLAYLKKIGAKPL